MTLQKTFGISTLLGAFLIAASGQVSAAEPTPADVKEQFEKLKAVVDRLTELEKRLNEFDSRGAHVLKKLQEDMSATKEDVRALQQDLSFIKDQLKRGEPYTAKRIDTTPAPRNAQVRLINDYVTDVSVLVNGVQHRLLPGEQALVTIPAGSFTYQVVGVQPFAQTRTIESDSVKDIRIHLPRP